MTTFNLVIEDVKNKALQDFVPIIRDQTLEVLIKTAKENRSVQILEIGTATGYSGLNLLSVEGVFLTTIEKEEIRFKEAQTNFKRAEVENRVEQILGDAREILKDLREKERQFDFIFLDGPKGQYYRYLTDIKVLLKKGGILFADNILLGGLIKNESLVNHKNRTMFKNMKKFLNEIQSSDIFQTRLYDIDDGFSISIKK